MAQNHQFLRSTEAPENHLLYQLRYLLPSQNIHLILILYLKLFHLCLGRYLENSIIELNLKIIGEDSSINLPADIGSSNFDELPG